MSNVNMNNAGVNCKDAVNQNTCSLDKTQFNHNSKNNDGEYAAEFNPNLQASKSQFNATPFASEKFKPNHQQMPVSERSAWH